MSCGCILRAYKISSLCQGCKNLRHQLAITTEFCIVVPNICGLSICNLLHAILLAPRILRCLVCFCKICVPLHYTMKYLPPPPPLILLRWHYSPMWTFTYLMDISQSALFFDISFQFLVLHLFIFVFWSSS
jgi:hypothetical protein